MEIITQRCAGIDIINHQTVVACVHLLDGDELQLEERTFSTNPLELHTLVEWLRGHKCTHVALKTTVSSDPVLLLLEGQFEIGLVDEEVIREESSRKTGVSDAAWLAEVLATGVIPSSTTTAAHAPALETYADSVDPLGSFTSEQDRREGPLETSSLRSLAHRLRQRASGVGKWMKAQHRPPQALPPYVSCETFEGDRAGVMELRNEVKEAQSALQQLQEQTTTLNSDLDQVQSKSTALTQAYAKVDEISADMRNRTMAAMFAIKDVETRLGKVAELHELSQRTEERLIAIDALADHVAVQTSALERQQRAVRHAVVNGNRANKMVRSLDLQIVKLNEGMKNVARVEDAIERIEKLVEDAGHCMQAAMRLNEDVHAETEGLERNSVKLLDELRTGLDTLSARKMELEAIDEEVRALTTVVDDVRSRMDTLAKLDSQLVALTQRVHAMSGVIERVPFIDKLEDRLNRLSTLGADVDQRLTEQLACRAELEGLKTAWELLAEQTRDAQYKFGSMRQVPCHHPLVAETHRLQDVDATHEEIDAAYVQDTWFDDQEKGFSGRIRTSKALLGELTQRTRRKIRQLAGKLATKAQSIWRHRQVVKENNPAGQQITATPAGRGARVRTLRAAVALIATGLSSGLVIAGLLVTTRVVRPEVAGPLPVQPAVLKPQPDDVQVMANPSHASTPVNVARSVPGHTLQEPSGSVRRRIFVPVSIAPIYSEHDTTVSRPVPIRQELPPWPSSQSNAFRAVALVSEGGFSLPATATGVLDVVIGADGQVESAIMRVPIRPFDDRHVTAAAKHWRYRPALKNGQPVRYKKSIQVLFR